MSEAALRSYVKAIETAYRAGSATEHIYRPYLKSLLEMLEVGIIATNEPKHIKNCGTPDFIVTSKQTPLGYLETKDIAVSLDQIEHTDQMKRYLRGLANLILTDYIEYHAADDEVAGRVYINKTQYFEGVPLAVWEFHVGGYQVCQKWLKDRKGRTLSFDDTKHYQRIVAALAETITLMERIDETIEEHGGWPLQ